MKCPICPTVSLVMTDRSGIEIDYCPECRGVWLDRGELDKIIERAAPATSAPTPLARPYPAEASTAVASQPRRDRDDDFDDDSDDDRRYQFANDGRTVNKRRKKGLLGELFDF